LPPVSRLEEWSAGAVRIGFPFYTLGIILGTVWSYWGGDGGAMLLPEYLLGVGVWVLYAVIVLLSATTGWRGRRSAVLTVVGFLSTLPMMVMYVLRRLG
jgi:ABC-type transport system involved in cytochrome c biogenesis permease subunit